LFFFENIYYLLYIGLSLATHKHHCYFVTDSCSKVKVAYAISALFSHSNYPLSLHGKTNLYDYQTFNEINAMCWNSCLTVRI